MLLFYIQAVLFFLFFKIKINFYYLGKLYTITDVEDLHDWMVLHILAHPLFEKLTEAEIEKDPVVAMLFDSTEEGQKVTRNSGKKFPAVFRRVENP